MALIFMDGFDHYSFTEITQKWTARDSSTTNGNDIKPTSGRRGGGALLIGSSGGLYKSVPARATYLLGVAIYPVTIPTTTGGGQALFELRDGSTQQLYVFIDTAAKLRIYRGGGVLLATSDDPLPIATWSYVEFKATIDNAAGAYELRVNGLPWLTASGVDTQNSANAFANYACLGISGANDGNVYYDDFYLCDTSGAANNDFLGDVRIDVLVPNGPGTYQDWEPSPGTDHAALVDETSPNTTDYLTGATPGARETLMLGDLPAQGSVVAVQVCNYLAKTDAGAAKTRNLIRSGTTDAYGPEAALSTSYVYSLSVHETDPATGSAWSTAAVDALEVGVEVAQ